MKATRALCAALCVSAAFVVLAPAQASIGPAPTALGPDRGWIGALSISPAFQSDGTAWVAPFGGRIFATSNRGSSWTESHHGESDPVVTGFAVSPRFADDHTLYAAADDGIFRSTDGGTDWMHISSGLRGHFARVIVLTANAATGDGMFVATDAGVYRSFDAGTTWFAPSDHRVPVTALAVTPADSTGEVSLIAATSNGGLLISTNSGLEWHAAGDFPNARRVLSITVSPGYATDGTAMVGTDAGIYVSRSKGQSWEVAGLASDRISTVTMSPSFLSDGRVFAGSASGNGVFESSDAGGTWHASGPLPFGFVESLCISPNFANDGVVFAGTAGRGIIISRDGGKTWRMSNSGLHAERISTLNIDGNSLAMAGTGGMATLSSHEALWRDLYVPSSFLTAGEVRGNDIFVGTRDQGLLVSKDHGGTWASADIPSNVVSALALSPSYKEDRTVVAAGDYMYVSPDGGVTWKRSRGMAGNDVQRIRFSTHYDVDKTIFAATVAHQLYRSTDGGMSWKAIDAGLPYEQYNDVLPPQIFDSDSTIYAASAGDGIFSSTDGGTVWRPMSSQPSNLVVTALAWSPSGSLLAGTEKGIYEWSIGRWSRLSVEWDAYVTALAVQDSQGSNPVLYLGTLGDGVWSLPLNDVQKSPTATASIPTPVPTQFSPPAPSPTAVVVAATSVPLPTATAPTTMPALHPKITVLPTILVPGEPGLVTVRGPGLGLFTATLTARSWVRKFSGKLSLKGVGAFGFVAPRNTVSIVVKVVGKHRTGSTRLVVRVARRPVHAFT